MARGPSEVSIRFIAYRGIYIKEAMELSSTWDFSFTYGVILIIP